MVTSAFIGSSGHTGGSIWLQVHSEVEDPPDTQEDPYGYKCIHRILRTHRRIHMVTSALGSRGSSGHTGGSIGPSGRKYRKGNSGRK